MKKRLLYGTLCGAGAAALALSLWAFGLLERLEYPTWNWRVQKLARPGPATDRIAVVLLDQHSLDWASKTMHLPWPWPREVYGPIIAYCRRGGAKAIAFDVLFLEPSVHQVHDDEAFAAEIGAAKDFVGAVFLSDRTGAQSAWPTDLPQPPALPDGFAEWHAGADTARVSAARASFPIPEVAAQAAALGNVSDSPDRDGVFRRTSLFRVFDGRPVFSLGLAALLPGDPPNRPVFDGDTLRIGTGHAPLDRTGRAILRYRGPSQTHLTFNAAAVFQSEMRLREGADNPPIPDPAVFKDRYVLFGFSAPGLMDQRAVPASDKPYPGVEIYATALDNFLSGDFLRDMPPGPVALTTLLLALLAGLAMIASRKAWQSVAAFALFLPAPLAIGFVAYERGFWFPVVVHTLAALVAQIAAVIVNYATEGRQKAFIKQAFRHYLSPQVIDNILRDPSQLRLGGERRELTLFFSDLQGFSSLSEKLDPTDLTSLLNDYLSDMTDIVLEEGGTLDKYEGDAIIAFWNAPLSQPDHAVRACRAALRCQRKLAERRAAFRARCGTDLLMRIGIHTGDVVVGNMGSRERFDYTVLGDAANLASRLEGANKAFGTFLMISEAVRAQTGGAFLARELARLRVVGRAEPVLVHELVGFAGEPRPAPLDGFAQGLALWQRGELTAAIAAFDRTPNDPPCRAYAARGRALLEAGAAPADGVWNLTEK